MKKICLLLLLLISTDNFLFAQKLDDSLSKLNNQELSHYYSLRAKHQRVTGLVMAGGGVLLTVLGAGISVSSGFLIDLSSNARPASSGANGGDVLAVIGVTSFVASLPVLFASFRNTHKAKLLLQTQTAPTTLFRIQQTMIGIAIPLGQ